MSVKKVPLEVAIFIMDILMAVISSQTKEEAARRAIAVASKVSSEKLIKAALNK
jgi:sensor histidine kinase regulating citrate/malate metabolism